MVRRFRNWFRRRTMGEKIFLVIGLPIIIALPLVIATLPPAQGNSWATTVDATVRSSGEGTAQVAEQPLPTEDSHRARRRRSQPPPTETPTATPDVSLAVVGSDADIMPTPTDTPTVAPTETPIATPTVDPHGPPTPTFTATATATPRSYWVPADLKIAVVRPDYVPLGGDSRFSIRIQNTSRMDVHQIAIRLMPNFYRHFTLKGSTPEAARTIDLYDGSQRLEFDGVAAGKTGVYTIAFRAQSAGVFSFDAGLYADGETFLGGVELQSLSVGYPTPAPTPTPTPGPTPNTELMPSDAPASPSPAAEPR